MLRTLIVLAGLLFFISNADAQIIYKTDWKSEAAKKVYVTDMPAEADIVVFKTEWKSDATEDSGQWYFTEWKDEADLIVYFTEWRSEADLVIYYTEYKEEAGKRK
ncbi:MAG TPA: DUF6150 family protein [Chitinophagales bacterium]|nr:DUF6150 family protein [Chitinophagales bacterium]HMZ89780.1 DUF6150 family protein [Chitinophagales bacterium]HNE47056.1 DUF6150 family protein [Chitinophagales bacterium]HNF69584.1 DUF6150 family protein [Chitinophagales bacterium]HNI55704.1 DUF6150 family protein [Chitinophagales bacterium]